MASPTNYVAMYAKANRLSHPPVSLHLHGVGNGSLPSFLRTPGRPGRATQLLKPAVSGLLRFFGLSSCGWLTWEAPAMDHLFSVHHSSFTRYWVRTMFPAYNTLFVNLAPNNQRGTATSTYLTSWDVGIGAGMLLGGYIAEIATFKMAYLFGAALTVISLFYFRSKVAPHFHRHKLR